MDYKEYSSLIIIGFLFPNNYMGAVLLAFLWNIIDKCMYKESYSLEFIISHIKKYGEKEQQLEFVTLLLFYYIGHYLRNKLPL